MGNTTAKCFRGKGKVISVVLLNGDVAEFREPVKAATVMQKFPRHVVLHCTQACTHGRGQHRRVNALRPDQYLRKNESYLVTPIQATENSKPFLDSLAFFALNACNKKLNAKLNKRKKSKSSKWWIQILFEKIFMLSRTHHQDDTDMKPLLRGSSSPDPKVEPPRNSMDSQDWRPSLECILESPSRSTQTSPHPSRTSSGAYASYPRLDFR